MMINPRTSLPASLSTNPTATTAPKTAQSLAEEPTDQLDWAAKRELERWHQRLRGEAGVLMTPPLGQVEPAMKQARNYLNELVNRLAGPDIAKSDIDLRVELFSGDVPQAAIEDSKKMEDNWKSVQGPRRWPIRDWLAIPENHDDKAIYRLVIDVGMLKTLENEDELAFVLAQQIERALDFDKQDPKNEKNISPSTQSFVDSRDMQVAADRAAIKRIAEAGFNPRAAFHALNRLYSANPVAYPEDDLNRALVAAAHNHEAEGIRVGAVEAEVENYVRRGETSVDRKMTPMPALLKLEARPLYNKPVDDMAKFKANYRSLAESLATDKTPDWMFPGWSTDPPDYEAIRLEDGDRQDKEEALLAAAEHLDGLTSKTPQQKVDGMLRLMLCLRNSALPEEGFSGPARAKFHDFMAKYGKDWNADKFIDTLVDRFSDEETLHFSFVDGVLYKHNFQDMAGDTLPGLAKAATRGFLNRNEGAPNPYNLTSLIQMNHEADRETWPMAKSMNEAALEALAGLDFTPMVQETAYSGLSRATEYATRLFGLTEPDQAFKARIRQVGDKLAQLAAESREQRASLRLQLPLQDPRNLNNFLVSLGESESWQAFTPEFDQTLRRQLIDIANISTNQPNFADNDRDSRLYPEGIERRFVEGMKTSGQTREGITHLVRHMLPTRRVSSNGERKVWLGEAARTLAASGIEAVADQLKNPDRSQNAAGMRDALIYAYQLKPEELPDTETATLKVLNERVKAQEFVPKREDYQYQMDYEAARSRYYDGQLRLRDVVMPLSTIESRDVLCRMALLGHNAEISEGLVKDMPVATFQKILEGAESALERYNITTSLYNSEEKEHPGTDAGAFLMDGLVAVQGKIPSLDSWYRLELALLRGDFQTAKSHLDANSKRQGYECLLEFLQGNTLPAYRGLQSRIQRRKEGQPALPPLVAVFASLAAFSANDLGMLCDRRLQSGCPFLDSFFAALGRHLAGKTAQFPKWEQARGGLRQACVNALAHSLPDPPTLETQANPFAALESSAWRDKLRPLQAWRSRLESLRIKGLQTLQPAKAPEPSQVPYWWSISEQGVYCYRWQDQQFTPCKLPSGPLAGVDEEVRRWVASERWAPALRSLVGHPRLLHHGEPVQLRLGSQCLRVSQTQEGYRLDVHPRFAARQQFILSRPGSDLEVCFPATWDSVLSPLLQEPLEIPSTGLDDLRQSLAPWIDQLEIECQEGVPAIFQPAGQGQVVARLQPSESSLQLEWIWQLPNGGPSLPLLSGPARDSLFWKGELLSVSRNFELELSQLQEFQQRCPSLPGAEGQVYPDLDSALDLVCQLRQHQIPCEWPSGKAWSVRPKINSGQMRLQVESLQQWFALSGRLRIDEELVLELGRTLQLARLYPGRYWRLDDEHFVEISQELSQHLQTLDVLLEQDKNRLLLPALAAPSLQAIPLNMEPNPNFSQALERLATLEKASGLAPLNLPGVTLRPYQCQGIEWLRQRVQAGLGACLADDMGLGKTLQVLALLSEMPGPSLVVCPTSVIDNWMEQAKKFAPSLHLVVHRGSDRGLSFEASPSLVITSYRLLLGDQSLLCTIPWQLVILDEAQCIKNPDSQTARAAYSLQSQARIALTGTPIENRLLELWSLFQFLNPGLLGSLTSFRRRYEKPPGHHLTAGQELIRQRIAPFLLRRLKSQVLQELPARTEIDLPIELSPPEIGLYERLRREAAEKLEKQGQKFEVLAHLTRLRQACCHPSLVAPQAGITSSKFQALLELVENLRQGRHRCLVFSQFTSLLDLLQVELQSHQITFLRLDGSTPAKRRGQLVQEFQQGAADLFLISLKAGGTGLNLTAADYVVHLDPWWNPASEDQASDRAHRIGQHRPVTIYRFFAADTVEEKVRHLHTDKRKLANQWLADREDLSPVSLDVLRQLLIAPV